MKHIQITLFLVLISFTVTFSQESLKVISYNIWNGFEWGKDTVRKEKLVQWVKSQNPDVIALQELCGFNKDKLAELAKQWGHNYSKIVKNDGYPVGITSTKPIEVKERILKNMHHGALLCKTHDIDFMVVHFSPFSYKKRHEEAGIILTKLMEIRKKQDKYIVLGDFNALSPFDAHLYAGNNGLLQSKIESEKLHKHVRNLAMGELEYGAVSAYLGFPLIDVVQKFAKELDDKVSCPTQVFEEKKGERRHSNSTRIDYILVSPSIAKDCKSAIVANKAETYYLSDHYPVVAEFQFK